MSAVKVNLGEKLGGSLWNIDIDELKVFNFTEKANKDGVEVDSDEAFLSEFSFLADKEELVELLFGIFFNASFPLLNFLVFELLKVLDERVV